MKIKNKKENCYHDDNNYVSSSAEHVHINICNQNNKKMYNWKIKAGGWTK